MRSPSARPAKSPACYHPLVERWALGVTAAPLLGCGRIACATIRVANQFICRAIASQMDEINLTVTSKLAPDGTRLVRPVASWNGVTHPYVVPKTKLAKRTAGLAKVNQDLLAVREALGAAIKQTDPLLIRSLWFLAATTYARCFIEGNGRHFKLEERDHLKSLDSALRKQHDFVMHTRHNHLAHAGLSSLEGIAVQVVLDASSDRLGAIAVAIVQRSRSAPHLPELETFDRLAAEMLKLVQPLLSDSSKRLQAEMRGIAPEVLYANAIFPDDAA